MSIKQVKIATKPKRQVKMSNLVDYLNTYIDASNVKFISSIENVKRKYIEFDIKSLFSDLSCNSNDIILRGLLSILDKEKLTSSHVSLDDKVREIMMDNVPSLKISDYADYAKPVVEYLNVKDNKSSFAVKLFNIMFPLEIKDPKEKALGVNLYYLISLPVEYDDIMSFALNNDHKELIKYTCGLVCKNCQHLSKLIEPLFEDPKAIETLESLIKNTKGNDKKLLMGVKSSFISYKRLITSLRYGLSTEKDRKALHDILKAKVSELIGEPFDEPFDTMSDLVIRYRQIIAEMDKLHKSLSAKIASCDSLQALTDIFYRVNMFCIFKVTEHLKFTSSYSEDEEGNPIELNKMNELHNDKLHNMITSTFDYVIKNNIQTISNTVTLLKEYQTFVFNSYNAGKVCKIPIDRNLISLIPITSGTSSPYNSATYIRLSKLINTEKCTSYVSTAIGIALVIKLFNFAKASSVNVIYLPEVVVEEKNDEEVVEQPIEN